MYRWWKLVHIAAGFFFALSHGASVTMLFRLRRERDRERIRWLLQLSGTTARSMYVSLAVVVVAGILAAERLYTANWWKQRWMWLSLAVLVAVLLLMLAIARPYYKGIAEAVGLRPSGAPRVHDEDLDLRLASARPWVVAALGAGGLAGILYLMVFQPTLGTRF